jgi:hypothetical protein
MAMKRTDIERKERELKRESKRAEQAERRTEKRTGTVGEYIKRLAALFFHDGKRIYNIKTDVKILELIEEMKQSFDQEDCLTVFRKAVRSTGITEKDLAFEELKSYL